MCGHSRVKNLDIELPEGEVERHPTISDDDEWDIKTEHPRRMPPKSEDFRRSKHVRRKRPRLL